MKKVSYKCEDIEMVLKLLDSIEIRGAQNARFLAVAYEKIRNDGEMIKEDTSDGSEHSL